SCKGLPNKPVFNGWSTLLCRCLPSMRFAQRSTFKRHRKGCGSKWLLLRRFPRRRSGCFEPASPIPYERNYWETDQEQNDIACFPPERLVEPIEVWDEPRRLKFSVT